MGVRMFFEEITLPLYVSVRFWVPPPSLDRTYFLNGPIYIVAYFYSNLYNTSLQSPRVLPVLLKIYSSRLLQHIVDDSK